MCLQNGLWSIWFEATDTNFLWKISFSDSVHWRNKILDFGMTSIPIRSNSAQCIPKIRCLIFILSRRCCRSISFNNACYMPLIINFCWPKLDDLDVNDKWSQQDDTTCRTLLLESKARAIWGYDHLTCKWLELLRISCDLIRLQST